MGQKVNPHGLRVGVIKNWDSRWFAKKADFGDTLVEDYNLRKVLKKQLGAAGVPKIEIERDASRVRIHIHCAKPAGMNFLPPRLPLQSWRLLGRRRSIVLETCICILERRMRRSIFFWTPISIRSA